MAPEVSVSTVAATATSTGHHMLKIEGFKLLKAMHANGSYFESCRFEAAGYRWKIRCYPNGLRASDAGCISLFLMRERDDDDDGGVNKELEIAAVAAAGGCGVHAEFRFVLVYPGSRLLPCACPQHAMATAYTFQSNGLYGWGFPRFVFMTGLEGSGFLKGDCFTVRCDITVVEKSAAVKDELVKAADMARMGMLCKCKDDDLCERRLHMLKIQGFKHLRGMHGNDSYFESCRFDAAGHTWKLICYPRGDRWVTTDYISLFLMRDDDASSSAGDEIVVHAKVRFELVYHRRWWLRGRPPQYGMSFTAAFHRSGDPATSCWGVSSFASVENMKRSGFLMNDCLAVRCDITVVES